MKCLAHRWWGYVEAPTKERIPILRQPQTLTRESLFIKMMQNASQ